MVCGLWFGVECLAFFICDGLVAVAVSTILDAAARLKVMQVKRCCRR